LDNAKTSFLRKKGKTAGYPLLLKITEGIGTDQNKKETGDQYQEHLKKQGPVPALIEPVKQPLGYGF
jgi:hypothetical protein